MIGGLRQMANKRKLRGAKLRKMQTLCKYLEKNLSRMRYDEYLVAGYPIASGVIEGACRYVVKDRMERAGMAEPFPAPKPCSTCEPPMSTANARISIVIASPEKNAGCILTGEIS